MNKPVLSPKFLAELARENPLGIEIQPAEVAAWFDIKWPTYRERGYRNHQRSIRSWWAGLRLSELEQARERIALTDPEVKRAEQIAREFAAPQAPAKNWAGLLR